MKLCIAVLAALLMVSVAAQAQVDYEHQIVLNATADNAIHSTIWAVIPNNLSPARQILAYTGTRIKLQPGWLDLCAGGAINDSAVVLGFHSRHLFSRGPASQFGVLTIDQKQLFWLTQTGVALFNVGKLGLETEGVKIWKANGIGVGVGMFGAIKFGQHLLGILSYQWRSGRDNVAFWRHADRVRLTTSFNF